jgi:hypothetical protein
MFNRKNQIKHNGPNQNIQNEIKFYPRVINNTDVHFTGEEVELLSKSLKYNLHYKSKDWVKKVA